MFIVVLGCTPTISASASCDNPNFSRIFFTSKSFIINYKNKKRKFYTQFCVKKFGFTCKMLYICIRKVEQCKSKAKNKHLQIAKLRHFVGKAKGKDEKLHINYK